MSKLKLILITFATLSLCVKAAIPPQTWEDHSWDNGGLLLRQGFSANAAVYYDDSMDPTITWPLSITSDMWRYVKSLYGGIGNDPRLYVILHSDASYGRYFVDYYQSDYEQRNVIDIGQSSWNDNTGPNLDTLAYEIAMIIDYGAKNVAYSPSYYAWDYDKWPEIFTYDLYTSLGWASEADRVFDLFSNTVVDFPRSNTAWFRDWFYPIYSQYGNSTALNRYFDLISSKIQKSPLDGTTYYKYDIALSFSEFIHFWSGAAGADLTALALNAFGPNDRYGSDWTNQMDKARWKYPDVGYEKNITPPETWQENWLEHDQLLTRQDFTEHAVTYYDDDMDPSITWPLSRASDMWGYVKSVYGGFGGNPRLYVIVHSNKYWGGRYSVYFDWTYNYRNSIDVGEPGVWKGATDENLDLMAGMIANIVQFSAKSMYGSPALAIWQDKWVEIFIYDLYSNLGWTDHANRVKAQYASNMVSFPRAGTNWFKDWFYPIYMKYGKSTVLNRFFDLLSSNFVQSLVDYPQYRYDRDLNLGEFVYFWSGAARADLRELALKVFGPYDEEGEDWRLQWNKARKDFPGVGSPRRRIEVCKRVYRVKTRR